MTKLRFPTIPRHPTLGVPDVVPPTVHLPGAATTGAMVAPKRRGSIRTRFLLIGLIPVLTLGAPWLTYTLTIQKANDERLLLESVGQLTSNYSERILDLEEALGLPLEEPEIVTNALRRTEALIHSSALPITNVAVINQDGKVIVAYSNAFPEGSLMTDQDIVKRWTAENPTVLKAMRNVASETFGDLLQAQQGFKGRVNVDGQSITLASALIPGNEGVSVITVDPSYIDQRVRQNVVQTVLYILGSLIVTVLAVLLVTSPLVRRLRLLAQKVELASRSSYGDERVTIDVDGNDEVTDMQEAAQRLNQSNLVLSSMLEDDVES